MNQATVEVIEAAFEDAQDEGDLVLLEDGIVYFGEEAEGTYAAIDNYCGGNDFTIAKGKTEDVIKAVKAHLAEWGAMIPEYDF